MSDGKIPSTLVELRVRNRMVARVHLSPGVVEFRVDGSLPVEGRAGVIVTAATFKPTNEAAADGVPIWQVDGPFTLAGEPMAIDPDDLTRQI